MQHGCSESEIVVMQIFNLDDSFYTLEKYLISQTADFNDYF